MSINLSGCGDKLQGLHELGFGAIGTDDVLLIGDESATNQARSAVGAEEAIVVPVTVLERDELGASDTGDWFAAGRASFGKQLAEAFGAVRLVVARCEAFAGQRFRAVSAGEALPVPWFVLVGYAAAGDDLKTNWAIIKTSTKVK